MKKYTLIAIIMALSIFNVVVALANNGDNGNKGCQSLIGCSGSATCGSDGVASGCYIACTNEAQIFCPRQ